MPSKLMSRQETFFLQMESAYGTIPNTTGTATVANANACRMMKLNIQRVTDTIARKDKTGSRSQTIGVAGRKIASWDSNASLVTNGVVGIIPDHDPIYQCGFGGPAVVKTGTATVTAATNASPISITATAHGLSNKDVVTITGVLGNTAANGAWCVSVVDPNTILLLGSTGNAAYTSGGSIAKAAIVYAPVDAQLSFTAWSFRTLTTGAQRAAFGNVVKELNWSLGEDIATFQGNGAGMWYVDNINFANATTTEKGGLTAFPSAPAAPVTNGNGIPGFKGRAVINGVSQVRIRSGQIKYTTGLDLPRDLFGSDYVDLPEADERSVTTSFSLYEDDSTGQTALEQAAISKAGIDLIYQIGTTPGSIVFLVLSNVQLASPVRDDGSRAFVQNYGDSRAYGTTITSLDELKMWMV